VRSPGGGPHEERRFKGLGELQRGQEAVQAPSREGRLCVDSDLLDDLENALKQGATAQMDRRADSISVMCNCRVRNGKCTHGANQEGLLY